jgi:hypothetical protein
VGRSSGGKHGGGPWYGEDRPRILFERDARFNLPLLTGRTFRAGPKAGRVYHVPLEVPFYEPRDVEIRFPKDSPRYAIVTVDGPIASPHRYDSHRLCLWYPSDPSEQKWIFRDGLLALLGMISAHLFREGWWRETGEWLGPEAAHGELKDADAREEL